MASKKRQAKPKETVLLHLTDLHYGRKTPQYDTKIFAQWLANLSRQCRHVHNVLRPSRDFDEFVIALGGDINDGSDIYPAQATEQDDANVLSQAIHVADALLAFAREQADAWGRVRVECVPGNHGRAGRQVAVAASWDTVAYELMARSNRDKRIAIHPPGAESPFIRVFAVYEHRYLLYHGHDIYSYSNIPWYGIHTRLSRWATGETVQPWDVALLGHFHTMGMFWLNGRRVLMSGTMLLGDDWGVRKFGLEPAPHFWLFGVSPKQPVTWQIALDFREGYNLEAGGNDE